MATTYGTIERQVHQALANITGADVGTVETNYAAASSLTNRLNTDFAFTPVRDALLEAQGDAVLAIAETPGHVDRPNIESLFTGLTSGATIPNTDGGGASRIGSIGRVNDTTTGKTCNPTTADRTRDYSLYSGSVYAGSDAYLYSVVDAQVIWHTRVSVFIYWPTYSRPTFVAGNNIYLPDRYSSLIVVGAVMRLAPKEARYMPLYESMHQLWVEGIQAIKAYKLPAEYLPGLAVSGNK